MGIILKCLPSYSGPYAVSTHDVELGSAGRCFSRALVRSTRQPALQLDSTLFTIFYPTSSPSTERMPWLERPLSTTARGYSKFLGKSQWLVKPFVYLFGSNLYLATYGIDRPLLLDLEQKGGPRADKEKADEIPKSKFPIVVFSHGLSGNRTTYSQFCGELASKGFVVVAVEHRDGSGPVSIVKLDNEDLKREKIIDYIKEDDIFYENEKDRVPFLEFRGHQLEMRQEEISQILSILQQVNLGIPDVVENLERENRRRGSYGQKGDFSWKEWKGRLDFDENLIMAGHSFGGATTIQILRANSKYGFKKGLALDPWADPIPPAVLELDEEPETHEGGAGEGASSSVTTLLSTTADEPRQTKEDQEASPATPSASPSKESRSTISVPFLVINSEAFTLWKPHFYLVRNIVEAVRSKTPAWFFTILGSVHVSFSDLPLFLPSYLSPKKATTPAPLSHSLIVDTSLEFLNGEYESGKHLGGELKKEGDEEYVNPARGEGEKGPLKRIDEDEGFVRLHVKKGIA